jgi:hypothetical protein
MLFSLPSRQIEDGVEPVFVRERAAFATWHP